MHLFTCAIDKVCGCFNIILNMMSVHIARVEWKVLWSFIWDIVITSILFVSGKAVQNFCSVMPSFPIVSSYNIQCLYIFILCYFSRVIKPTINIWICLLYCYCNYVGKQTHTLSDITIKVYVHVCPHGQHPALRHDLIKFKWRSTTNTQNGVAVDVFFSSSVWKRTFKNSTLVT